MKHPALRRWLFCAVPALIAAAMYWLLPHFPQFTETVITRGLFRVVAFPAEWLVSLLPFSLTETVVVLAAPVLLTLLTVWIVRIVRRPHKARTVERGCRFVAWCLSLALLIFMVMDGANFSRLPLGTLMELPDRDYTAAELAAVTADLAAKAGEARKAVAEDENGCMVLSVSLTQTLKNGDDCYVPLRQTYPYLISATRRVKGVLLSHQWSYTGYTGVYCPWLGEASVNIDITPSEIGHTVTHEIAHTMGFAKENECNFLAYLACVNSDQPDFVYSGYLAAYIYCSNALHDVNATAWRQISLACSAAVRRDLKARNAYWKQFRGQVMEKSQQVNDTFIKANGVESGVISYDEMVELVLRYYDKNGWI